MRRKRRRLTVSTFPFMAVLLCAMGSLIFLLLVLDRQAKLAAQAKAKQAIENTEKKKSLLRAQQLAARQAEWEKRKRDLHQRLLQRHNELLRQIGVFHDKNEKVLSAIASHQSKSKVMHQQLQSERTSLLELKLDIEKRKQRLLQTISANRMSQKQLAQMALELDYLERTLLDLKLVKKQSRNVYSLVPFKGQRGQNREPIYAECTSNGVIFHPGGLKLDAINLSPLLVRRMLESRVRKHKASSPSDEDKPYVFLLVRPDGIKSYYAFQSAMVGLPLDFGYELIGRDWKLDFSQEGKSLPAPELPKFVKGNLPTPPGAGPKGFRPNGGGSGSYSRGGKGGDPRNGKGYPRGGAGKGTNGGIWKPAPGQGGSRKRPTAGQMAKGLKTAKPSKSKEVSKASLKDGTKKNKGQWKAVKNGAKGQSQSKGDSGNGNSGGSPQSVFDLRQKKYRPASPLSRLTGNRDWRISVVCNADGVYLPLARIRYTLENLVSHTQSEHPLISELRRIIARRQSSVRSGEPLYQPIIHFEVQRDGLRSYHLVYPILERLRLPMVREDVKPKSQFDF